MYDSFASIPIVMGSVADDPGLDFDCPYFTRAGMKSTGLILGNSGLFLICITGEVFFDGVALRFADVCRIIVHTSPTSFFTDSVRSPSMNDPCLDTMSPTIVCTLAVFLYGWPRPCISSRNKQ